MIILLINDELNRGGAETLIYDLLIEDKRESIKDVKYYLFLRNINNDYYKKLCKQNISVFTFDKKYKFSLKFIYKIRQLLYKNHISIIHSHSATLGLYFYFAKIGLKIPMVQTIHGFLDKRSPSGKFRLINYLCSILLSFTTNRTFAVSEFLRAELIKMKFPSKKLYTIYNGIDFQKFENIVRIKKDFSKKITFGMVGNFNAGRNHIILIDAFSKLLKYHNNVFLLLAGRGELLDDAKEKARELDILANVQFLGEIHNVNSFLKKLDCFVYSSKNETFGISVIEAIYTGVPVIVSDNGPFKEITENGKYATLFKTGDSNDCYNVLKRFIDDSDSFIIKSKTSKKHFKEVFNIEKNYKLSIRHYRDILLNNKKAKLKK